MVLLMLIAVVLAVVLSSVESAAVSPETWGRIKCVSVRTLSRRDIFKYVRKFVK